MQPDKIDPTFCANLLVQRFMDEYVGIPLTLMLARLGAIATVAQRGNGDASS